jgi:flagellar biogenesis protein FliO
MIHAAIITSGTSAAEVWGMIASILTVLTLILGGVWKLSRLTTQQLAATRDNTTAIAQLTRRLGRVEGALGEVPSKVADTMTNGHT